MAYRVCRRTFFFFNVLGCVWNILNMGGQMRRWPASDLCLHISVNIHVLDKGGKCTKYEMSQSELAFYAEFMHG